MNGRPENFGLSPQEFARAVGPDTCLMGLDVGTRTVGLSVGRIGTGIATALDVVRRTRFARDAEAVKEQMAAYDVRGLVIGLPLNMDGSFGPRAQSVRDFGAELALRLEGVPVMFQDERLSTKIVDKFLVKDVDMSRTKRKQVIDKLAARQILQDALESLAPLLTAP